MVEHTHTSLSVIAEGRSVCCVSEWRDLDLFWIPVTPVSVFIDNPPVRTDFLSFYKVVHRQHHRFSFSAVSWSGAGDWLQRWRPLRFSLCSPQLQIHTLGCFLFSRLFSHLLLWAQSMCLEKNCPSSILVTFSSTYRLCFTPDARKTFSSEF